MPRLQEAIFMKVEFEVSSYEDYPQDRFVQVWKYVGDYNICISLPYTDKRVQLLKRQKAQD